MVILGIDPGLNATGFGIIETIADRLHVKAAGEIRPPRGKPLAERLSAIHGRLLALMATHRPDTAVIEKIFTHHGHVTTAAMMGHARGVACLAAQTQGIPLVEYPSTQVKRAVTGNGHASKEQVGRMVGQWIDRADPSWSADATDALALAIAHAHAVTQRHHLAGVLS
ncbi:MAG: crossover junction endodeoxyribonuclease RuvC [Candidatus Omnitrophica bacterium]|nr:crossover junction endodeoxyribonuclease RuvC [Candidatus Omnitrophota bacterium]